MKTIIKAAVAVAIGLGVTTGGMPALAGPAGAEVHSTTVSFSDLNLSREAGVNELYGRLKAAARTVCGSRPDGRNLVMSFYWKQCYDGALDSAVGKVAHVGLSEVHLAQTGRRIGTEQRVAGTQ